MEADYDVVILGAGAAGLSAGLYTTRAMLKTLILEQLGPGGQLLITDEIENYPGFPDGIKGQELAMRMEQQTTKFGSETEYTEVVDIENFDQPIKTVKTDDRDFTTRTIIIATGGSHNKLGVAGEDALAGRGVSYCAVCDGNFFRGQNVVVVGGGDAAMDEGHYLSGIVDSVTFIHRRDELRAEKILQDRLFRNDKITPVWNSVLDAVIGDGDPPGVTAVRVRNVKFDEVTEIPIDGVFIAIGHDPNTQLFRSQLEMDCDGYIITAPDSTVTSVPGVYAAGDVQDKIYRQAVTAAGTGCMSALEAENFLTMQTEPAEAAE